MARKTAIKAGDWVTFTRMPEWGAKLPARSRRAFRRCLGKVFRVSDITADGVLMLDVGPPARPYVESILVEPEFVARAHSRPNA